MKRLFFLLAILTSHIVHAQQEKPKLVIGIVVDQMRYDYLYKYYDKYGEDGFKKLLKGGFSCENTHYNYTPTYTGPGHASIFTGATPSIHGIVGNNWYDESVKKMVYCADDTAILGNGELTAQMSPKNLKTSTIGDELRLSNNFVSKCIGIGLKDRSAIFPAGRAANAAYWLDGKSGHWVSSSYYMAELPAWVQSFNGENKASAYLKKEWKPLFPISSYTESGEDDSKYEMSYSGESRPVFPHKFNTENGFEIIKATPYGNAFTLDFAKAAIQSEKLGKNGVTDFLTISFSSTDYIGHQFGPSSIELEDTYLRLDKDLADFLKFLDKEIGLDNVLIFLTADHGAAFVPAFLEDHKMNGGLLGIYQKAFLKSIDSALDKKFGDEDWIEMYMNQQIYFNQKVIRQKGLSPDQIYTEAEYALKRFPGIYKTIVLEKPEYIGQDFLSMMAYNGYYAGRSGQMEVITEAGWLEDKNSKGTSHGSGFTYDSHVPLLWFGWHIKPGISTNKVEITDIAPTLAFLLKISQPSGANGNIIQGLNLK